MKQHGPAGGAHGRRCFALIALVCVASVIVLGCERHGTSPVIARIGRAVFTLDDLSESIPPEYRDRITREQNINYVKQWIDIELLYQEALRRGVDKEPQIRRRLAKMKKDLLYAEMIGRNAASGKDLRISDEMVQAYYEQNKQAFVRPTDAVRIVEIIVDDAKTALDVRNQVNGGNFLDVAARYSKASVQDPRSAPFVPVGELPPQVAQAVAAMRVNATSNPIKTDEGYSVIWLIDRQLKGSVCGLDEVRDEIANRLSTKLQKAEIDRMLSDLRLKSRVEYRFDLIPDPRKMAPGSAPRQDSTVHQG